MMIYGFEYRRLSGVVVYENDRFGIAVTLQNCADMWTLWLRLGTFSLIIALVKNNRHA